MAVRNESVRLSLDDAGFSTGVAKAAAATALLDKRLDNLDGTNVHANRGLSDTAVSTDRVGASMRSSGADIDRFSGRLRLIADAVAILGPGLVPIAAVGVPAVTGLATALAAAGTAGAGALVAFGGVGDAITAVEKARLEPTVANLEAAQQAMAQIGPHAQEFVTAFQDLRPVLGEIRDSAAEGLFPGVIEAMDSFEQLAPRIGDILREVNEASGEALANGVESLTTERWTPFFHFIAREMPAAVTSLSKIVGDLAHGATEMWMAFDPGNDAFLGWLEGIAAGFDNWASSAAATEGIQEFLAYVAETGPQVADLFGSLVNLLVQVAQAAAPLGGPVLKGLTAIADVLASLADSNLGTVLLASVAAMSLLSRATAVWGKVSASSVGQFVSGQKTVQGSLAATQARMTAVGKAATLGGVARGTALLGGLAVASTGAADGIGLTNSASLALMGSIAGPWGAALGAGAGFALDLKAASESTAEGIEVLDAAIRGLDGSEESIAAVNAALTNLRTETEGSKEGLADMLVDWFPGGEDPSFSIKNLGTAFGILTGQSDKASASLDRGAQALANARNGALTGKAALESYLRVPLDLGNNFDIAAASVEEFAASFDSLLSLLDRSGSLIGYEKALDDLTQSLKDNGDAWNVGTEAGRANLEKRNALVDKAIERSQVLKSAGDELGAQRILDRAITDLERFGERSPAAKRAMAGLVEELKTLDQTEATPQVDADDKQFRSKLRGVTNDVVRANGLKANPHVGLFTAPFDKGKRRVDSGMSDLERAKAEPVIDVEEALALSGIANVRSGLASLHDKNVTITTTLRTVRTSGDTAGGAPALRAGSADGSTVPKTGLPYADRHPYLLADGEEVISNRYGQADRWRPFLKLINANRAADGDTVGGDRRDYYNPPGSTHSSSSSNRLSDNAIDRQVNGLLASLNGLTAGLHGLSKKEVDIRERDLERTEKQLDRLLDKREERAKKEADADKARLDSMIETQRAFEEQVGGLFKSDVFAKGESTTIARFPDGSFIDLGKDINSLTPEDYLKYQERGATFEQSNGFDPAGGLTGDIGRLEEAMRLFEELRAKGFDGPAFRELAANADVERLRAMTEMSRAELQNVENLYNKRDKLAGQVGQFAGKDYDPNIKALRQDFRESLTVLRDTREENRAMKHKLTAISARLDSIEKTVPPATGTAVGAAIGGAVADARRGR